MLRLKSFQGVLWPASPCSCSGQKVHVAMVLSVAHEPGSLDYHAQHPVYYNIKPLDLGFASAGPGQKIAGED